MNIYVGNLVDDITEDELKGVFSGFGEISGVNIVKKKTSGQSKCFAFIEMPNKEEADKAIKDLNESELKGSKIKVNEAKQREGRQQRRFSGNLSQRRFGSDFQQSRHTGGRSQNKPGGNRPSRKPGV